MENAPWTLVMKERKKRRKQERRDAMLRRGMRAGTKREKGDALVIKTHKSKYKEILEGIEKRCIVRSPFTLRSIRRTRTGKMTLELNQE